jgi:hypothetical protein
LLELLQVDDSILEKAYRPAIKQARSAIAKAEGQ